MSLRAAIVALLALLAVPAAAHAGPLGLDDCGPREGVHQCSGVVATWDGVPLDTTVTLPREGATGLPLVVAIHGFGNSKHEYLDPASTAYTDNAVRVGARRLRGAQLHLPRAVGLVRARRRRGWRGPVACLRGYIHLADVRYEARDTQELAGRLVDEGVADPRRIGVTGDSYGGGQSLDARRAARPRHAARRLARAVALARRARRCAIAGGGGGHPVDRPDLRDRPQRLAR